MIKRTLTLLAIILFGFFSFGQNSNKAKTLLDEVYKNVTSYENIYIDFKYTLENTEANIKQETKGNVSLKGDKYLANLFGATRLFDGSKVYTIVPENEEVTIDKPSQEENTVTPSKMLTFYKSGHTYKWDILQNVKGRKIQFVKLVPIESNTEISSILLGVDAETKNI